MNLDTVKKDTKIDLEDFQTILSEIGKIAGFVKIFNIDDLSCEIINEYTNEVKNAKAILVEFELLPTTSLLAMNKFTSFIDEFMGFINDESQNGCEVTYGLSSNNDLQERTVKCKILFTGLV
ncbi:hypothetical protein PT510_04550 [Aliarcobacter butzleri]|uniref:hypothetical protein n=1 Tax=Aliarcobacter butzleri TaxID=28197 RepID=UPI0024DE3DC6|nr:hypothetical protein [Aliarcobacter butzleri]MDK2069864.1 hypothetical protein [Aliarcobacter butzleri]